VSEDPLEAVMFDMDGLLVDTEPLWFEVETEVMARLGGTWGPRDQVQLVGGSLSRSIGYMLAKAAEGRGSALAGVDGETVGRWMVGGMAARIADAGVTLMPGARELLTALNGDGVPCALVTSSERRIMDAVLGRLRCDGGLGAILPSVFAASVCGADVAHAKPDAEPYLLAAERLGVRPSRCVVLEDAPNGVASAEAAGCLVVAVPGLVPLAPRNGRVVVRSLREVSVPMLRELAASRDASAS
jgi:beta-phosphoglucomutase-like phosphatase (HAD superfamily)